MKKLSKIMYMRPYAYDKLLENQGQVEFYKNCQIIKKLG